MARACRPAAPSTRGARSPRQTAANASSSRRSGSARSTGNAFANLYTGRINGFDQSTNVPVGHYKFWNIEGYAQDDAFVAEHILVKCPSKYNDTRALEAGAVEGATAEAY